MTNPQETRPLQEPLPLTASTSTPARSAPAPSLSTLLPAETQALDQALARWQSEPGGLLPALHALQDELGFIPPATVAPLAQAFGLSRAEVHGVITYYHHFRQTPPARHSLTLCQAEACQARGARALTQQAQDLLQCTLGQARADHHWQLEGVACLGLCASGPALVLDGTLHAQVDAQRLQALLAAVPNPPTESPS